MLGNRAYIPPAVALRANVEKRERGMERAGSQPMGIELPLLEPGSRSRFDRCRRGQRCGDPDGCA